MTAMAKADMRTVARARRKQFVAERGSAFFPAAPAPIYALLARLSRPICVAGYCAMSHEPDIGPLLTEIEDLGAKLALPWVGADGSAMIFRQWSSGATLEMAASKFRQPLPSADTVVPDMILIPLLGFDRRGNRLGQGAGYYDRTLAMQSTALRIGIAWSVQEFPDIPTDTWDMPLDAILTDAEWIIPAHSRCAKDS
jgi:5-formyltetrahydrofolate cyclo-ligase